MSRSPRLVPGVAGGSTWTPTVEGPLSLHVDASTPGGPASSRSWRPAGGAGARSVYRHRNMEVAKWIPPPRRALVAAHGVVGHRFGLLPSTLCDSQCVGRTQRHDGVGVTPLGVWGRGTRGRRSAAHALLG